MTYEGKVWRIYYRPGLLEKFRGTVVLADSVEAAVDMFKLTTPDAIIASIIDMDCESAIYSPVASN